MPEYSDSSSIVRAVIELAEILDQKARAGELAEGLELGRVVIVAETHVPNRLNDLIVHWTAGSSRHLLVGMLNEGIDLVRRTVPN